MRVLLQKLTLLSTAIVSMPFFAMAEACNDPPCYDNPISAASVDRLVGGLLSVVTTLITPLAGIAVMIAAFLYVTAGGNPEKVARAHKAISWAAIGVIIILMSRFLQDVVIGVTGQTGAQDLEDFLTQVGNGLGTIVVGLTVIFVMYSAYLFMTGGDNEEKITTAKKALIYALVGVGIAFVAFAIPPVIRQIVGGA